MGVAVNWDAFFNRHQSLGYKELARRMEQEGTIIVNVFNNMFKDPELKSIIDSCFNMYNYYTRIMHRNKNLG
jgi:hypothetical protein